MILRVNPNRMELMRLKKRLMLAQRGHKLLQDKLEEMMRKFLFLLKDIDRAKKDFELLTEKITRNLLYCRITTTPENFKNSLEGIHSSMAMEISTTRIMNVKVPSFNIKKLEIQKNYDFLSTSAQMDLVVSESKGYIEALFKLAGLLKTLDILSFEIERTRRRVNALKYKLIPSIEETIRYINQKLNELERGNLVRLMSVKEVVRSH